MTSRIFYVVKVYDYGWYNWRTKKDEIITGFYLTFGNRSSGTLSTEIGGGNLYSARRNAEKILSRFLPETRAEIHEVTLTSNC